MIDYIFFFNNLCTYVLEFIVKDCLYTDMHRYVLGRLFGVSSIRGFYIHSVYSAGGKIYLATFIEKNGFPWTINWFLPMYNGI